MLDDQTTLPVELRQAYQKSWQRLIEFLQKECGENTSRESKDYILKYEVELAKCIKPILSELRKTLSKGEFSVGRGIIHINSFYNNRRIRIPFCGPTVHLDNWRKLLYKSDIPNQQLIFLQPDLPSHLLTELMWRFQPQHKWGEGYALGIFSDISSSIYLILNSSLSNDSEKRQNEKFKKVKTLLISKNNWEEQRKQIVKILNKWRKENESVELGREYNLNDIERMIRRPRDILFGLIEPYKGRRAPKNIFYLSDIVETEYLGAMDFELKFTGRLSDKLTNEEIKHYYAELEEFIQKVKWDISKYIIELVTTAERNYASVGKLYRDVYFISTNNEYQGINNFCDLLDLKKSIYKKVFEKNEMINSVFNKVRSHFILAKGGLGSYWRGYQRHSFEVACTVAGVMDILFKQGNYKLENALRQSGPTLDKLDSFFSKDTPYLFRQLFKGLSSEKDLFLIPFYRDHFIHSFYCFIFGLVLMAMGPKKILPDKLRFSMLNKDECEKLIGKWFVVSMWHDIAYVLQKGHELLEDYVIQFMHEKRITRYRGLLPWIPSLGHLMQLKGLLEELRTSSENSLSLNKDYFINKNGEEGVTVAAGDFVVSAAFDITDHGVWSGLLLNHGWDWDDELLINKEDMKEIVKAIMVHNVSDWKVENLVKDFKGFQEKKFKENKAKGYNILTIDRNTNHLGYLLAICDLICQAGREAPEIAGKHPSKIGIRIENIYPGTDKDMENSLIVNLRYSENNLDLEDMLLNYYCPPAKYLGLNQGKRKKGDSPSMRPEALCISLLSGADKKDAWFY